MKFSKKLSRAVATAPKRISPASKDIIRSVASLSLILFIFIIYHTSFYSPKNSLPAINKLSSRPSPAVSSMPNGNTPSKPEGREMHGNHAIFAGTVKISSRYIASGFEIFSPILNAGVGVVGVKIRDRKSVVEGKSVDLG